ncbi:MAG: hypothetical protein ABIJ40_00155 [Bacteroidota bacterium]
MCGDWYYPVITYATRISLNMGPPLSGVLVDSAWHVVEQGDSDE